MNDLAFYTSDVVFYGGLAAIVLGHFLAGLTCWWMMRRHGKRDGGNAIYVVPCGAVKADATTFDASMVEEQEEVRA